MATAKYVFEEGSVRGSQELTGGGTVTLEQDALIQVTSSAGLVVDRSLWTVEIDGVIAGSSGAGVGFSKLDGTGQVGKNNHLTVGTEGAIWVTGFLDSAVVINAPTDVTNSGVIHASTGAALKIESFAPGAAKGFSITNNASGEIFGVISDTVTDELMTLKNQGDIAGGINWYGPANFTNSGTVAGMMLANPVSTAVTTLTNSGTIGGDISLAEGNDIVKNTGLISGFLDLNGGKNSVTNGGEITGAVMFGDGANTFINTGQLDSTLSLGNGNNKLTNSGTISGNVLLSGGDDVVTNTKSMEGTLNLNDGNNKLTNSGSVAGNVTLGMGDDVVTNTKSMESSINLGDGHNTFTNSGFIGFSVIAGTGDDVFKNTGTIEGGIFLGAGDDTFTGGNAAEDAFDEAGDDSYKLGGGNDALIVDGLSNFTADGGAGIDSFDASTSSFEFNINLDSKAVTVLGTLWSANSAFETGGTIGGTIKNFENASGGAGQDLIIGSSGANQLNGGDNNDFLVGGLGADKLFSDAGVDTFIYLTIKDSGTTKLTEDQIIGFQGGAKAGGDRVDLGALDADSKAAGDQAFLWIGVNQAFTGVAGQLRGFQVGSDLIVQADVNGDRKVDFAINLVGISAVDDGDFVL